MCADKLQAKNYEWLNTQPTRLERGSFRLALINYLKKEKFDIDGEYRTMEVMRATIPYLAKLQKKWADIDPRLVKTNTMKQVQALYDTIGDEMDNPANLRAAVEDAVSPDMTLDEAQNKSSPVKVFEGIEEPQHPQPISLHDVFQTPKQPDKLQTPAKTLKSKTVEPKISPSISSHSKGITKDPLVVYFKEQIKQNRAWFLTVRETRTKVLNKEISVADATVNNIFQVMNTSNWLYRENTTPVDTPNAEPDQF
jgi:hypothetical protein